MDSVGLLSIKFVFNSSLGVADYWWADSESRAAQWPHCGPLESGERFLPAISTGIQS